MFILFNSILPKSGLIDPLIMLKRVVFPAPLGPIKAVIDEFFISRETLLMAWIPPKFLYR